MPGRERILVFAALITVCVGSALLGPFFVSNRAQFELKGIVEDRVHSPSVPRVSQGSIRRLEEGLGSIRGANGDPSFQATPCLVLEDSSRKEAPIAEEAQTIRVFDDRSAHLSVSDISVRAGEEAQLSILFGSLQPISSLEFTVVHPKETLVLRKVLSSPKDYGEVRSALIDLGGTRVQYRFNHPFRAFAPVPLAIAQVTLSRGVTAGSSIPIHLVSTSAVDAGGKEVPVRVEEGTLSIVPVTPPGRVSSPVTETPATEVDFVVVGDSSTESVNEGLVSEAENAPDPTVSPSLEDQPTPSNQTAPERMLWLTDASGAPGDEIVVSLHIDDPTGVRGVHFEVYYDASLLKFLGTQAGPLFDRFLILDYAVDQSVQVAMLGEAPPPGYRDACVCDFLFRVSDNASAKADSPIHLRGAHLVSEQESFYTVTHSGRLFVWPQPAQEKWNGEVGTGSLKSTLSGSPVKADYAQREAPLKQPRNVDGSGTAQNLPVDRSDLNFDGIVDAIDLSIFFEFFRNN